MTNSAPLPLLVYDGDCGFCMASVRWGQRRIRRMPAVAPYQALDLEALGLTTEACATAVQYVAADGRVFAAHDAVAAMLRAAGAGWRVLGVLMCVPGVHWVAGVAYRWIARNRHRLRSKGAAASCSTSPRR